METAGFKWALSNQKHYKSIAGTNISLQISNSIHVKVWILEEL